MEEQYWDQGLPLDRLPSESRFFRVKEDIIHPFLWTTEFCHLSRKGRMLAQYRCFGEVGDLLSLGLSSLLAHVLVSLLFFCAFSFMLVPTSCCGTEFSSLVCRSKFHLDRFGIIDICSHKSCVIVKWLDI